MMPLPLRWAWPAVMVLAWSPASAPAQVPRPPASSAASYLLVDYHSGRELASRDAGVKLPPASLTKLMTVYVAGQFLRRGDVSLDDAVLISEKAWRTGGSKMFIEVGKRVLLEDLLRGIIIQSGNDASIAVAEHIAGSEEHFAVQMNVAARELGMADTQFRNSTGLGEQGHVTTARDLAVLSRALIRDFPELYAIHAEREFTYNRIRQRNRNLLLWQEEGVDGIKTGHTEAAGYCLVASAERAGMRLISVVMGTGSERERDQASQALLSHGFIHYETRRVLGAGERRLKAVRVWKGYQDEVSVGTLKDLYVTVPRDTPALQLQARLEGYLVAPLQVGQRVGVLELVGAGDVPREFPLVTLEAVEHGSLLTRMVDGVWLYFRR